MPAQNLKGFLAQQSATTFKHYKGVDFLRGRSLWVAVRNPDALPHSLGGRTENLSGFSRSEAFIYSRPEGTKELWVNPVFGGHRDASLTFVEQVGDIRLTGADTRLLDSDHAFTRGAASMQERVYLAEAGFVRMNLIDRSVNRARGGGFERRHSHRNFTNEIWCEGHFFDLIKALGGHPEAWNDLNAMAMDGVNLLLQQGHITQEESSRVLSISRTEMQDHIQASDTDYAVQTGQVDLSATAPPRPETS
jgi:hypothetical protein